MKVAVDIKIDDFSFPNVQNTFFTNLGLTLQGGHFNFLLGTSGTGKTTFLNVLLGQSKFTGEIKYIVNGEVFDCARAKNKGVLGMVSQNAALVPWMSIHENLLLPCKLNSVFTPPSEEFIIEELNVIGLQNSILTLLPHQISFGMQARVSIARALLYKPAFIYLDELFTGIDTANSDLIANHIVAYLRQNMSTCLSITHDIDRAIKYADNIFIMNSLRQIYILPKPYRKEEIIALFNQTRNFT